MEYFFICWSELGNLLGDGKWFDMVVITVISLLTFGLGGNLSKKILKKYSIEEPARVSIVNLKFYDINDKSLRYKIINFSKLDKNDIHCFFKEV